LFLLCPPGPAWDDISIDAKDLVAKMLAVKSESRISVADILSHSWLTKVASAEPNAPDTSHVMSEEYRIRIKRLALQGKFKRCFVDDSIQIGHLKRKENFKSEIPLLDTDNVKANCTAYGFRYGY
jgi:serine/threonine protein kinase